MSSHNEAASNYFNQYGRLLLANFVIVAILGCIMRYKIGFDFPYLEQKYLQHAHSHFAFASWISLALYLIILHSMQAQSRWTAWLHKLIFAQYLMGFGMLFSFAVAGYNWLSITFSTATVIISYIILYLYIHHRKDTSDEHPWTKWFLWALIWQALSSVGTFVLAYMMASHNIDQHSYLASVYFFLHFQYNGWFLFGIIGAALYFLKQNFHVSIDDGLPFRFLKWSVLPAYGLSVLWMDLPWFVYILVVAFVILQTVGIAILLLRIYSVKDKVVPHILPLIKWGSLFAGSAYGIKFLLQLFSVIPAMSKLAFGFRPIVIAYLHLVLLAASSTTLILLLTGLGVLKYNRNFARGFYVLLIGIFCNEAILALQGFASFEYIAIPWANMALFTVSIVMLTGLIVMFSSQWNKQIAAAANGFGHSGC